MKLSVDKDLCIGCGACAAICPKFFEMGDDTKCHIKGGKDKGNTEELVVTNGDKAKCLEAVDSCPVNAIKFEE